MIVIVDYGLGNLGSIANMLRRIGVEAIISSRQEDIAAATKLILPGVGAFDNGMANLEERGFVSLLHEKVLEQRTPVLGICLGLQLFTKRSEEGRLPGLGWIDAETVRFQFNGSQQHLKVPHMGWNEVHVARPNMLVSTAGEEETRFYFVHSYHLRCHDEDDVILMTHYGYEFPSAVVRGNIMGTQFHPEKSHRFGMTLLKKFAEYHSPC